MYNSPPHGKDFIPQYTVGPKKIVKKSLLYVNILCVCVCFCGNSVLKTEKLFVKYFFSKFLII